MALAGVCKCSGVERVGHIAEVCDAGCFDEGVQKLWSSVIDYTVETFDGGLVELTVLQAPEHLSYLRHQCNKLDGLSI